MYGEGCSSFTSSVSATFVPMELSPTRTGVHSRILEGRGAGRAQPIEVDAWWTARPGHTPAVQRGAMRANWLCLVVLVAGASLASGGRKRLLRSREGTVPKGAQYNTLEPRATSQMVPSRIQVGDPGVGLLGGGPVGVVYDETGTEPQPRPQQDPWQGNPTTQNPDEETSGESQESPGTQGTTTTPPQTEESTEQEPRPTEEENTSGGPGQGQQ
jgi:hypothetical protein